MSLFKIDDPMRRLPSKTTVVYREQTRFAQTPMSAVIEERRSSGHRCDRLIVYRFSGLWIKFNRARRGPELFNSRKYFQDIRRARNEFVEQKTMVFSDTTSKDLLTTELLAIITSKIKVQEVVNLGSDEHCQLKEDAPELYVATILSAPWEKYDGEITVNLVGPYHDL
ncbi:hypothetical protein DdX_12581 [Ditylenchus destructor]|uniref:Uncharacterized protein n=1 Tax=Ditylenchus destructor TaxID=166010 RepID=A0AAD4MYP3_9BILA|nr:hypothetical protein DdX_12581 [Ditylenchus destructor]